VKQAIAKFLPWMPTGALGGISLHFVLQQEWLQAGISFITTAISGFATNFGKGFIKKFNQGAEKRGEKLADFLLENFDRLPTALKWKLSGFASKYYQSLRDSYQEIKVEGFQVGTPVLDLEDVFVPLQVQWQHHEKISRDMVPERGTEAKEIDTSSTQQIWHFLAASSRDSAYKRLAIVAAPGSGKTTLLQHVALIYAKGKHHQHKAPNLVPILLYLREIRQQIIQESPPDLPKLVEQAVKKQPAFQQLTPPPNWFRQRLQQGKCLIMLDGLDEVANQTERQKVSQWVDDQMRAYRHNQFLITSRPHGFQSAPVDAGLVLEVQPFSLAQMSEFIRKWYLQTEIRIRLGRDTPAVRQEATENAENLIHRIIKTPAIRKMASNPLLVTMIATVHYCGNALPGRRVELYQKICDVLLGTRQAAKKIPASLTSEQQKSVLQVLALDMMQRETRRFTLKEGEAAIREALATVAPSLKPQQFFENVKDISGLLVEKELGTYEFAHLSFQEYLAAAQIHKTQQQQILIDNFANPWWGETIRLYAAQSDATPLIETALSRGGDVYCLSLGYDCLQEGLQVEPQVRQQLEDLLEEGLASKQQEIADMAAKVKLSRRLQDLLPIDETKDIDLRPVSRAEYQLYVRNCQNQNSENGSSLTRDTAQQAVLTSFRDASLFCTWLSLNEPVSGEQEASGYFYRLPTVEEAKTYALQKNKENDCWTGKNRGNGEGGIYLVRQQLPERYQQLFYYLATERWEEADKETAQVMLQVARKDKFLEIEDIKNFPCEDLRWLDWLWVQCSGGHYGFSVQKEIWYQKAKEISKVFYDRVGWNEGARVGRVGYYPYNPYVASVVRDLGGRKWSSLIYARLVNCNI